MNEVDICAHLVKVTGRIDGTMNDLRETWTELRLGAKAANTAFI